MKRIITILILLILTNKLLFGQAVPFTVVPTSNSQQIVIESLDSIFYNGNPQVIGDAIGAFYLQDETLTCAGYLQFDGVANSFTVYGNDAVDNGFMPNETMQFRYWRKAANCLVSNSDVILKNYSYTTGVNDTMVKINANPVLVGFDSEFFCKKYTSVLPVPLNLQFTSFLNLGVSVAPPLPGYDNATHQITSFAGAEGNYTFSYNTLDGICLINLQQTIRISAGLQNSPALLSIPPTCLQPEGGKVVVDTTQLNAGTKPFVFKLLADKTGFEYVSLNGIFHSIPSDTYRLIILDQQTCGDTLLVAVPQNTADCLGSRDIITPRSGDEFAELFLPWEGETKVYNYQWQLVNTFTTPSVWKGVDQQGLVLKTGVYFIFTDGKKMKEITVVNESSFK